MQNCSAAHEYFTDISMFYIQYCNRNASVHRVVCCVFVLAKAVVLSGASFTLPGSSDIFIIMMPGSHGDALYVCVRVISVLALSFFYVSRGHFLRRGL